MVAHKAQQVMVVLVLLFVVSTISAQVLMNVERTTNSDIFSIDDIAKITFNSSDMMIDAGSISKINIGNILKITFQWNDTGTAIHYPENANISSKPQLHPQGMFNLLGQDLSEYLSSRDHKLADGIYPAVTKSRTKRRTFLKGVQRHED